MLKALLICLFVFVLLIISDSEFAGGNGWDHKFHFYAFTDRHPGTIPFAVGHADYENGGWKYRVSYFSP